MKNKEIIPIFSNVEKGISIINKKHIMIGLPIDTENELDYMKNRIKELERTLDMYKKAINQNFSLKEHIKFQNKYIELTSLECIISLKKITIFQCNDNIKKLNKEICLNCKSRNELKEKIKYFIKE